MTEPMRELAIQRADRLPPYRELGCGTFCIIHYMFMVLS